MDKDRIIEADSHDELIHFPKGLTETGPPSVAREGWVRHHRRRPGRIVVSDGTRDGFNSEVQHLAKVLN
jgi:hypothetical protein